MLIFSLFGQDVVLKFVVVNNNVISDEDAQFNFEIVEFDTP